MGLSKLSLTLSGDELKKIVPGVVITTILVAATQYVPIFGFITALFIPLPVCYYRLKLGRSPGWFIPGAVFFLILIQGKGFSFDVMLFAELLVLGFVLGEVLELELSVEKTILFPSLSVLGFGVVTIFFYSSFSDMDFGDTINHYVKQNLELTVELYSKMDMPREVIDTITSSLNRIQYVMVRIIPAMTLVSAIFVTWINLLVIKFLAGVRGMKYPDFGDLAKWKSPEYLVWLVIAAGVLLMIPSISLKIVGLNIVIVLVLIYFLQGISIISFYFEKKKLPRILRGMLYSLVVLQQLFSLLIIGLGFFDLWIDFRKIKNNEKLNT